MSRSTALLDQNLSYLPENENMDITTLTKDNLSLIIAQSGGALEHFYNKNQDDLVRFVFCALEKMHKVSKGINRLYPHLEEDEELEFPIGILVRSQMMDCLMVQHLKHTVFVEADKHPQPSKEALKATVKGICYKLINAGTNSLIGEVYLSENLTDQQKSEIAKKFASRFPQAFDLTSERPKQTRGFQITIKDLYLQSNHSALITRDKIYNLYTFYSKYDHLSDWTSLAKRIPFDQRKGKIDLSVMLMMNALRDLLAIVSDFDPDYAALQASCLTVHTGLESMRSLDNGGDES